MWALTPIANLKFDLNFDVYMLNGCLGFLCFGNLGGEFEMCIIACSLGKDLE